MTDKPIDIIFDVYGTLIKPNHNYNLLKDIFNNNDCSITLQQLKNILLTTNKSIGEILPLYFTDIELSLIDYVVEDINNRHQSLTIYDDVDYTLTTLIKNGYNIHLCSNVGYDFVGPIHRLIDTQYGIIHKFYSCELGFAKPSSNMFNHIKQTIDRPCIMVGDTFTHDVIAPPLYGIQSFWISRASNIEYPSKINSLTDLIDRLK